MSQRFPRFNQHVGKPVGCECGCLCQDFGLEGRACREPPRLCRSDRGLIDLHVSRAQASHQISKVAIRPCLISEPYDAQTKNVIANLVLEAHRLSAFVELSRDRVAEDLDEAVGGELLSQSSPFWT